MSRCPGNALALSGAMTTERTMMDITDPRADRETLRAHSTPDPEQTPTPPTIPVPDDVPDPAHAPVEEPVIPDPPIRAQ
ncbi:hypothetical protein LK540_00495 [Massilia sp. IC2-278]|uniref:hypothetical protein n=1 Tax=Massilia sp. IC2-278 TaxID=2887200 RepID=UPI001E3A5309|nr:hypothetical protein [Massilia sp. IC2-278]MCC2958913.1 hypothetical protein [Massilia sp. IC2-278]